MSALQRPLLELYAAARRRGEDHRASHPLALTQRLHVAPGYGLVVGEEALVTKVITPLTNLVLWAAVRFQARILRRHRNAFGAAFVPLACSDPSLAPPLPLSGKQRFLVSLTHPSLFACVLRRVASPKHLECHAFVCASAEEALTLCSQLQLAQDADRAAPPLIPSRASSTTVSRTIYSEEESRSDVTLSRELRLRKREDGGSDNVQYSELLQRDEPFSPKPPPRKSRHSSRAKSPSSHNRLEVHPRREGQYSSTPSPALLTPHWKSQTSATSQTAFPEPRRSEKLRRRAVPNRQRRSFSNRHSRRHEVTKPNGSQLISSSEAENIKPRGKTADNENFSRRIEERWEPATYWKTYQNPELHSSLTSIENDEYRRSRKSQENRPRIRTAFSDSRLRILGDTSEEMDSSTSIPNSARELQRRRNLKQQQNSTKAKVKDQMVLTESIELSSESEFSFLSKWDNASKSTTIRRNPTPSTERPKAYYFGYEAYNTPKDFEDRTSAKDAASIKVIKTSVEVHPTSSSISVPDSKTYIEYGKSVDKITINVPYSCDKPGKVIPHGVRCFSRTGQVRNWSTLSQTSDCSVTQSCATLPVLTHTPKPTTKIIRWSSDEHFVKKRTNFLSTLKRLSLKSLSRAKCQTEKFLTSVRNRLTSTLEKKKSSECSEDSAYTSEPPVCHSPRGWSPPQLPAASVAHPNWRHRRRGRRYKEDYDSGLEESHTDYRSESELEHFASQVTLLRVGQNHRSWSQTDLKEELGYIP